MKRTKMSVVILFLVLGFLPLAGAGQQMDSSADDGQLYIRYSPTLGMNVGLVIQIDGRTAGGITRGHVFHQAVSAGRHQLTVKKNGRGFEQYSAPLDVAPGQTHSYVVKLTPTDIVLQPSGVPR